MWYSYPDKMKFISLPLAALSISIATYSYAAPMTAFQTVVNNNDLVPGTVKNFNSYNQPSVNDNGVVVFRARSQGGQPGGQPASGVFTRDMSSAGNPIVPIVVRGDEVPAPNNTGATFNEFPSIPRIDAGSDMMATRGQSQPVLEYQDSTGADTRSGTAGIYTNPTGTLQTGMAGLGNVTNPDLSHFEVPNTTPGTKFDQFPGAPSPTGGDTVVFKGNWTDPDTAEGRTGVYFRDVLADGGESPVQLVADSKTDIPGFAGIPFGSTAPPSAANDRMVFVGVDNEAAPTKGGIYMADLDDSKDPDQASFLTTIASIGQQVVDKAGEFFTRFGEALSFDGMNVGYWGAWGTETREVTVSCYDVENPARREFCLTQDDGTTDGSGTPDDGDFLFDVPVNQGFFITDVDTLATRLIAETGADLLDFIYWNFSGKVPGADDEDDGEPARWRSSSFIASDGWNAAFKGTSTADDFGLYLSFQEQLSRFAWEGVDGSLIDPEAVDINGQGLPVTSLGIERDSYRNGWLTINASMTDGDASMAGVYLSKVPVPGTGLLLGVGGLITLLFGRKRQVAT